MKVIASIFAIASVNAACECLGTTEKGLPPASFFEGKTPKYPGDYGSKCFEWDKDAESCKEGGADNGKDWCTDPWCYVAGDNDCSPAAYDTVFFADDEKYSTLKFAVSACPDEAKAEEAATDASSALFASAMAISMVAVAATI